MQNLNLLLEKLKYFAKLQDIFAVRDVNLTVIPLQRIYKYRANSFKDYVQ